MKLPLFILTLVILTCIFVFSNLETFENNFDSIFGNRSWKFIHITKNAGTSFCLGIQKSSKKKYLCCDEYLKRCEDGTHHLKLREYKKPHNFIVIIRNPYNRFISAFSHTKYLNKNSRYYSDFAYKRHLKFQKYNDVNDFVKHIQSKDPKTLKLFFGNFHFHTQTDFMSEEKKPHKISKKIKVILQLENLESDLAKLKVYDINVRLPKDKINMNKTEYPDVKLNYNSIKFIQDFYKDDFTNFKKLNINYTYGE